jgi:hypothetical protein
MLPYQAKDDTTPFLQLHTLRDSMVLKRPRQEAYHSSSEAYHKSSA